MTKRKKSDAPAAAGTLFTDQAVGLVLSELFGLADPDEVLRKAGLTRTSLRALEGDDEVSTALETRLSGTTAAPWRLDPYDATVAPFIEAELQPLIEQALTGAWSAVPYGYSVLEAVYAHRDGGRYGLAELQEKPFEWFRPMRDGRLLYMSPQRPQGEVVDTQLKFFLTRRRPSYRNPYGEAILSRAYWPWFLRNAGWRAWARFLERAAGPLLLGKTAGDTAGMAKALAEAALSGAVAVGAQDSVEAISPPNVGQAFSLYGSEVDRRIQKLILGQTLTTDVGKGGSYALGSVHERVKGDRIASDHRMLQRTMQAVVNALCALNFPAATPPSFVLGQERGLSPERAARDVTLANAGIVRFTEKYLLDRYDFERGDIEVPEVVPPPAMGEDDQGDGAPPAKKPPKRGAKASLFAASAPAGMTPGQQAVDDLGDEAIAQAHSPIDPAAIRAAIRASANADDLVERLAELFADQPPEAYRELMERTLFAADVMGYAHAEAGQ